MRKLINTRIFIAVIFFCVGFLTNHLLVKFVHNPTTRLTELAAGPEDRFPVDPDDFDHNKIMETIKRMEAGVGQDMESAMGGPAIIAQREDDKFEYYDIPLRGHDGANRKLNVEIKDGLVRVKEDTKNKDENSLSESSSERMFTLDPRRVDIDRAEVLNEKDKIVIKIPKKQ